MLLCTVQEAAVIEAYHSGGICQAPIAGQGEGICSAKPDDAVDFFQKILHPFHSSRLSTRAVLHPYIAALYAEMRDFVIAWEETGSQFSQQCFASQCLCVTAHHITPKQARNRPVQFMVSYVCERPWCIVVAVVVCI